MASNFWAAYKDPRWQKKRLDVMDAAKFRCQHCYSDEKTLNVHHRFYVKGHNPWEYAIGDLICLCEDCHKETHSLLKPLRELVGFLGPHELAQVTGYVKGTLLNQATNKAAANQSIELSAQDGMMFLEPAGFCDAYGILWEPEYGDEPPIIAELSDENRIDSATAMVCRHRSRAAFIAQYDHKPDVEPFAFVG